MINLIYNSRLLSLYELIHQRNIPFAWYRLPHEDAITLLIQYRSFPDKLKDIRELNDVSGFVIAPFPDDANHDVFLLRPDFQMRLQDLTDFVIDELINILSEVNLFSDYALPACTLSDTRKEIFTGGVMKAVDAIRDNQFLKVILSKIRVESIPDQFNPLLMFVELCKLYSHALVYYWQIPGAGSWMGATPEPVLIEKNGQIYTVSLAGTQLLNNQPLSEVCWREKEIAEQAIVSRFIVQLIDKLGVEKFNIIGPHNFQAGNLVHLNTGFEFDATELKIPRGEFIAALHPTPSIAGLPRDKAMQFIQMHELHSRGYYTGLLGPHRLQDETHLYVNLRCMQLFKDELVLYSGAGITGSSVPENEWDETENKMMTLLKVIHAKTGC